MRGKPSKPQSEGGAPRRYRAVLLGVLVVALAVASSGVIQRHKGQGPEPSRQQQVSLGADRGARATSSGMAPSPAAPTGVTGAPVLASAAAPKPSKPQLDPPSPADPKAFNGAGFAPPAVPPHVTPVPVAANALLAEGAKGPLYYGTMADLVRVTKESQKIAQLQARSGGGPAAE